MKRKTVRTILVLFTVGVLTAACGSGSSNSGSGDTTVRIALGGAADGYSPDPDNALATKLQEETGTSIVLEMMPEDISASLAAGDSPDYFRVTRAQLEQYVRQGLVLDLTPYADQLADYRAFVGDEAFNLGTVDGKLSAITTKPSEQNYTTFWIRKDWLDTLGLEMPRTTDDFRAALEAFTHDDPDGNGKQDTYGLTGASPYNTFLPLWGSFGTPGPKSIYSSDGEVQFGYTDPGLTDAMEYVSGLAADGLVDPDSYTLDVSEARDRAFQGAAGVMSQSWASVTKKEFWDAAMQAQPDADWQQLDLLAGPDGEEGSIALQAYGGFYYALPASLAGNDEKIDKIIDLINYVSTDEGNRLVCYGVEDTHYTLDGDEITPLEAMDTEGGYFVSYQLTGRDDLEYLPTKFVTQREYIARAWEQPVTLTYEGLVVPPDGYPQADAQRFSEEQLVPFLTGERPVSEYPDFLAQLESQFDYQSYRDAAAEQLTELGLVH